MLVSGINPGIPYREKMDHDHPDMKKARIEQELKAAERLLEVKKGEDTAEKTKEEKEAISAEAEKFLISEYQLKELLFMAASRGTTSSVEKLIEVLKRQKEAAGNK